MRLLRDPLVAFLLIGGSVFALDRWVREDDNLITVRQADVARLAAQWQSQMGRPASDQELEALLTSFIREELLVREAQKLGLDRDDVIIRRRLAQKLTFVTEDLAVVDAPSDEALRAYFRDNEASYVLPATTTFSHIYFSPDGRASATADAEAALAGVTDDNWRELGDPILLRRTYANATASEVAKEFGESFARALETVPDDQGWHGPIPSGYGGHLIRIRSRTTGRLPDFNVVRARVLADFEAARRADANAAYFDELRARYRVDVES